MPVIKQKVKSRRATYRRPQKIDRNLSIQDYAAKRNKVLIFRGCGGLGDIMMHRMMFEDIKLLMPDAEIHFSCPHQYHDAVKDHPYVDRILTVDEVNRNDYLISYNTTTACGRYEMKISPLSDKHRSDIWANHCGFNLTKHNMHIKLTEEEKREGKEILERERNRSGPIVLVCPISAMQNKNLLGNHLNDSINHLIEKNCCPIGLHNTPVPEMVRKNHPVIYGLKLRQWMSVMNEADYVVSVDTAHLHCAGGLNKPMVGIFTFVNASTYCKYYPNCIQVQGPCPANQAGCYNWGACPLTKLNPKPCLSELASKRILSGIDEMMEKFPI